MDYTEYATRVAAYALIIRDGRILLSWFNGGSRGYTPLFTLPGGGVDFGEQIVDAIMREVHEETGYRVEVGRPLLTDTIVFDAEPPHPRQGVRVVYAAHLTGGSLGTQEVGGTTDFARWISLDELPDQPHSLLVDLALGATDQ